MTVPSNSTDLPDGKPSRTRSLEEVDQIFRATGGPASFIDALNGSDRTLRVLEVGFGWARVLLALAWQFRDRDIEFHGVDIEDKPELDSEQGLKKVVQDYSIFDPSQFSSIRAPILHYYDATKLHFEDSSIDFAYSAVTIRFVRDKVSLIEEVARVLAPNGVALLHIGESNWEYPYGKIEDDRLLTHYTNRLVLKCADELIPLRSYLKLFEGGAFSFEMPVDTRCILILRKHGEGHLDLDLALNEDLTISGRKLPLLNRRGQVRGGIRSVYEVRPARREAMREAGLLG